MSKEGISDVLCSLKEQEGNNDISVGEIVGTFEDRGFGPLLLVPALLALLPTGAIPGVPTICGVCIFLICVQIAFGADKPWLPKRLKQLSISRETLRSSIEKAQPYVKKFERVLSPRLVFMAHTPVKHMVAIYSGIVALCMIPLEIVPFAVALPALAISLTATGITNRDGLLIIIGIILQAGTGFLLLKAMP